jgi:hypothetical protein
LTHRSKALQEHLDQCGDVKNTCQGLDIEGIMIMSVLDKVLGSIQDNKEKESVGAGGWLGALIAAILVIIVTGIFGFIAWKRGKEMSKLLHEKAIREEEEHQAKVNADLAETDEVRDEAIKVVNEARRDIAVLEVERREIEEAHREVRARIDAITSWDDVDSFIGNR